MTMPDLDTNIAQFQNSTVALRYEPKAKNADEAIALFGDEESKSLVLLRTFEEYLRGYTDSKGRYHEGYLQTVETLKEKFPDAGTAIVGEEAEKEDVNDDIIFEMELVKQIDEQLDGIIAEERLNPEKTRAFVDVCFREGEIKETGTDISEILTPMSLFCRDRNRKKEKVVERLKAFFEKYHDIS